MSFQACDYSIACLLRSISQHQKNGVLALQNQHDLITISFIEGVIVGAFAQANPLNNAMIQRMSRANLIDPKDADVSVLLASPPNKLYQRLVGGGYLSHEMFVRLKFTYERDVLDSVARFQSEQVDFKPQLVQADDALSQRIYPCQLLLDFLEIELDERRFVEVFGSGSCDEVFVRPQVTATNGLTETEQTVWDIIGRGAYVDEVFSTSMLSLHQARDALLALHQQHFIAVGNEDKAVHSSAVQSETFVLPKCEVEVSSSPEIVDDDLQLASEDMESELSIQPIDADALHDVSEVFDLPESADSPYQHEHSNAQYIIPEDALQTEDTAEPSSMRRLASAKGREAIAGLATEDFLQRYLVASTVLFLLAIGVVLPQKLSALIEALRFFVNG